MTNLEELFTKYNFERGVSSAESIGVLESAIGFKLPDDYWYYALNYKGFEGFIGSEYVVLWEAETLLSLNNDYNVLQSLPNTIAIGSNGGGEFIGIEMFDPGRHRLIISPFVDLNNEYHIKIGDSFSGMLNGLDSGATFVS